jgi:hypothetical protein
MLYYVRAFNVLFSYYNSTYPNMPKHVQTCPNHPKPFQTFAIRELCKPMAVLALL